MIPHQFMHADCGHHFPGHHRAIQHALREGFGHLRNGHANRLRAQSAQRLTTKPRGETQPQAGHILKPRDALIGMDHAVIMRPPAKRLHFAEFLDQMLFAKFLQRAGIGDGAARGEEGQLKRFNAREAAGRIAGQGPDDIRDTIARLIEKLRRRATKLHGRKYLNAQAPARGLFNALRPGGEEALLPIGSGRQEVMQPKRDLRLRFQVTNDKRAGEHAGAKGERLAAGQGHGRSFSLPGDAGARASGQFFLLLG